MKFSRLLPVLILFFCWQGLSAQDIHYTLFDMAPLRTNPALTGAFSGTARIGGIYRGQWLSAAGSADIQTPTFYVDAPIVRGFRDKDWVGVGLSFSSDNAGPFNLKTTLGGISAAYHLAANKAGTSVLTLGGQYNQVSRSVEYGNVISDQTIDTNVGGQGTQNSDFEDNDDSYTDISAGALFRTSLAKETSLELGVAALHLNAPDVKIDSTSQRAMTLTAHVKYEQPLDEKWSIAPAIFYQTTEGDGAGELLVQAWAGRRMNQDLKLNMGLGWRKGDSGSVLLGADYKDLKVALSYDLNMRETAKDITNSFGGFEVSAYYIIKKYKTPTLPAKVLCPVF